MTLFVPSPLINLFFFQNLNKIFFPASMSNYQYRNPEDLTDSDEEVHPNIDSKSYRKFIKEQRLIRLNDLRKKKNLTSEEEKEMKELEYKFLPVDKDVSEGCLRVLNDDFEHDYSKELANLIKKFSISYFIDFFDHNNINMNQFEELIYYNLSESIKSGNDDAGLMFCKVGVLVKWAREFGRGYILKLACSEDKIDVYVKEHYQISKKAMLNLYDN